MHISAFKILSFILILLLFPLALATAQVPVGDFLPFKFQLEENFSPPNKKELKQEIAKIIELQKEINAEDLSTMGYWNASYPAYRWHQIMMEISEAHKGHKNGARVAILHLSIYDALAEVWKHKRKHLLKAPHQQNTQVRPLGRARAYSFFICEWSAVAGTAKEVIGYYTQNEVVL